MSEVPPVLDQPPMRTSESDPLSADHLSRHKLPSLLSAVHSSRHTWPGMSASLSGKSEAPPICQTNRSTYGGGRVEG